MNLIDHAIVIPESPDTIWEILRNIQRNREWQTDCEHITFLTGHTEGRGARWRYRSPKGKEFVSEVTAWYDRLGYEYIMIDGVSYEQNRGRIRLQEVTEGTLVQWTFSYELGGMFSGLRNSLRHKRRIKNHIIESLRNLYRVVGTSHQQANGYEAKASVREAPDVDARAGYQPRHPSVLADESRYQKPDVASVAVIDEPPVEDDDTKPNQAVAVDTSTPPEATPIGEVKDIPPAESPPEPAPISAAEAIDSAKADTQEKEAVLPAGDAQPEIEPSPPAEPEPINLEDTSEISVFDVFGLTKPSETQEMRAIQMDAIDEQGDSEPTDDEPLAIEAQPSEPAPVIIYAQSRGLRYRLRHQQIRLRRRIQKSTRG